MFNLIVKSTAWAENQDQILKSRIFEYTEDNLRHSFAPNGELDLVSLMALPTVFVEESHGDGREQTVRVGRIINGLSVSNNRELRLEYVFDNMIPSFSNNHFQTFSQELGIHDFEFTRTHWAVKQTDFYQCLARHMQPRRSWPSVFQLNDPEIIEIDLVSAMMPFHPSFNNVYATLQEAAASSGYRCNRADDIWNNPAVIQDVVSLIDRARIVICDCTDRNPNVFYEIGIAHTLGREVILITQNADDIPFDLRHLRYIRYLNNGEGLATLSAQLRSRFTALAR